MGRAQQRAIHALRDGYVPDIRQRTDFQRVACGLLQRLVAGNGGDGEQVNLWMMSGQQDGDGIIMAGVAVEDDFVLHSIPFVWFLFMHMADFFANDLKVWIVILSAAKNPHSSSRGFFAALRMTGGVSSFLFTY